MILLIAAIVIALMIFCLLRKMAAPILVILGLCYFYHKYVGL